MEAFVVYNLLVVEETKELLKVLFVLFVSDILVSNVYSWNLQVKASY